MSTLSCSCLNKDFAFKIFHLASSQKKTDNPERANIKVANFEPSKN